MTADNEPGGLPAQNIEAEQRVLGAILLENEALAEVRGILKPGDFYRPRHRVIFGSMIRLADEGTPIDIITLTDDLKKTEGLDEAGGPETISRLMDDTTTARRVAHHAGLVHQEAVRRNADMVSLAIRTAAADPTVDPAEMVENAIAALREGTEGLEKWKTPGRRKPRSAAGSNGKKRVQLIPDKKGAPPEYSEDDVALAFCEKHGGGFRFIPQRGAWIVWGAFTWAWDDLGQVVDTVRAVCREKAEKFMIELMLMMMPIGSARALAGSRFAKGVETFARSDPRMCISIRELDKDDFLVGTPGGVYDLDAGRMRPARREDYITRSTGAKPGGDCQAWLKFISDATGGDGELARYLRRVAGYCLTGTVREHTAFFLFGPAAAGKSTFITAVAQAIGDYARAAPIELLTPQGFEHPTILAGLAGARMVVMAETEEGRAIAESRFKSLVAGDAIAARYMREDYFTFRPQAKLVLHGNHRPRLRSTDESMRRRLHVVPFTQVVAPEDRDKELGGKLEGELGGIMAWIIQGALEWMEMGLAPPAVVTGARDQYFEGEDILGRFLEEETEDGQEYEATSAHIWGAWQEWCKRSGERERSQRWLSQQLEQRGYARERRGRDRTRVFVGLGILGPGTDSVDPLYR